TTGAVSANSLNTNFYFSHRGDLVAQSNPGGLWTKDVFDGAERNTVDYTTDGGSGTSWNAANTESGDIVLEQMENTFDANGNVILPARRQRFDSTTGAGALGSPTTGVQARVYFVANYFDLADRFFASANVGTNGGTAYTRPSTVPARSDTVLVTSQIYNAAGW